MSQRPRRTDCAKKQKTVNALEIDCEGFLLNAHGQRVDDDGTLLEHEGKVALKSADNSDDEEFVEQAEEDEDDSDSSGSEYDEGGLWDGDLTNDEKELHKLLIVTGEPALTMSTLGMLGTLATHAEYRRGPAHGNQKDLHGGSYGDLQDF
jgi:hypothetical protein